MGNEWREVRIEQITSRITMGPFGSDVKTDNFVLSGVPVIHGGNLSTGRIKSENFVFLTEEKVNSLASANAFPGDLIFSNRVTLGQVGLVSASPYKRYAVPQSRIKLTCDNGLACPDSICYFFKSPEGQHAPLKNISQTGVPAISRPVMSLKSICLNLPHLSEQRASEHILGTLDDKIELNRRMNETLEGMARALFKSWFVDFDHVRAKAEGRDTGLPPHLAELFSDAFEDSELGEIPKGWRVESFTKGIAVIGGGTPKTSNPQNWGGEIPWFSVVDAPESKGILVISMKAERFFNRAVS